MEINTQFLDWFSVAHFIFGLVLGYFYRKNWGWVLVWIVGWELLEYFILSHICCADFWLEKPINILGDVIVGLLGYIVVAQFTARPRGRGLKSAITTLFGSFFLI